MNPNDQSSIASPAAPQGIKPHRLIKLGIDVHLREYVVARQVDGLAPQSAQCFSPGIPRRGQHSQTAFPDGVRHSQTGKPDGVRLWGKPDGVRKTGRGKPDGVRKTGRGQALGFGVDGRD